MQVAALIPIAVFALVGGAVSLRLLLLWRRTREFPELCIGLGMVLITFAGTPLTALARVPQLIGTLRGGLIFTLGMCLVVAGILLLYSFTWKVFRSDDRWARMMMIGIALGLTVVVLGYAHVGITFVGAEQLERGRPFGFLMVLFVMICFVWTAIESLLYHSTLKKRQTLGLVDPVIVNRFLLWGASAVVMFCLMGGILVCQALGMMVLRDPIPAYTVGICGMISSVTWYLTFFSPAWYRRAIVGSGAAA
jgi:hypothetical protein